MYTYRGRKTPDGVTHAWNRMAERDGVAYRVNRDHPLIIALERTNSHDQSLLFMQLLHTLEETIPFDAVYADMASELRPKIDQPTDGAYETLLALAQSILSSLGPETPEGQQFLTALPTTEPFTTAPEAATAIQRKLQL